MKHHPKIIRNPVVLDRIGISNSTLNRCIKEGTLPPPVPLGDRAVGFVEHEIDAVIALRIAGKSKAEIQQFICDLVKKRQDVLQYTGG